MIVNQANEARTPAAERYLNDVPMGGYVNYLNGVPVESKRAKMSSPLNRHKSGHHHGDMGHATTSNLPTIQKSASIARNQPLKDARLSSGLAANPTKAMLASKSKARVHAIVNSKIEEQNMSNTMRPSKK